MRPWDRWNLPRSSLTKRRSVSLQGIGFGDYGDTHVRFALIENRDRIRQAIRGIKAMFRADGLLPASSKHIHENAE